MSPLAPMGIRFCEFLIDSGMLSPSLACGYWLRYGNRELGGRVGIEECDRRQSGLTHEHHL